MKFLALEEIMKPKPKIPAEQSREFAVAQVSSWLRNLPQGAVVSARKHDRAIIIEVEV